MTEICIYHADDDGFGAAWVVRKFTQESDLVQYVPIQYGDDPPDCRDKSVMIVDFSFKRDVMIKLIDEARAITVLDHHKTAEMELKGLNGGPNEAEIFFDMTKSGVLMAWEYCNVDGMLGDMPELIGYLDAGDLWQLHRYHDLKQVQAALRSYPYDFELWDHFMTPKGLDQLRAEGGAIRRFFDQKCEQMKKGAYLGQIDGHSCMVMNAPGWMASDLAGQLAEEYPPFAAVYFDLPDKRVYSLRSRGDFDVSELAKRLGGGGHKNAAGFQVDRPA